MITRLRWRSRHDVGHGQHPRPHATTGRVGVVAHVAGDAAELLACLDQAHNESAWAKSPLCQPATRRLGAPTTYRQWPSDVSKADRLLGSALRPWVDNQTGPLFGPACSFAFVDLAWGQPWVRTHTLSKKIVVAVRRIDLQLSV